MEIEYCYDDLPPEEIRRYQERDRAERKKEREGDLARRKLKPFVGGI